LNKALIAIGSPKQAHYYRKVADELESSGFELVIVGRNKECTMELIKHYFDTYEISNFDNNLTGKFKNIFLDGYFYYELCNRLKPNLLISTVNPALMIVGKLLRIPSVSFNDTDHAWMSIYLTYPFSDRFVTNLTYRDDFGSKHKRFDGFTELSYTNFDTFKPLDQVSKRLKSDSKDKLIILRFAAYEANHDLDSIGFSKDFKIKLVKILSNFGQVLISSEKPLPSSMSKHALNIKPYEFHSYLYYADICISDGSSTAVEASLIGTPTLHYEKFLGAKMGKDVTNFLGYLDELINDYKIFKTYNNQSELLKSAVSVLDNSQSKNEHKKKLKKLFVDKEDFARALTKISLNLLK